MRLFSKREIDVSKALERRLDIDEGKKLAERVDGLRRLVGEEEANLTRYRNTAVPLVMGEIQSLIAKKDALVREAEAAEARNANAKLPVDQRLAEIAEREAAIGARLAEVERNAKDTGLREAAAAVRTAWLDGKALVLRQKQSEIDSGAVARTAMDKLTSRNLASSAAKKAAMDSLAAQANAELLKKEAGIAAQEREIAMHRQGLANERDELNHRERAIIDREEIFTRELIRQEKNHG